MRMFNPEGKTPILYLSRETESRHFDINSINSATILFTIL